MSAVTPPSPPSPPSPPPYIEASPLDSVVVHDPVTNSKLLFTPGPELKGMQYSVEGVARPVFHKMVMTAYPRGPRLDFVDIGKAATMSWKDVAVLHRLRKMADATDVHHNIPEDIVQPKKPTPPPAPAAAKAPPSRPQITPTLPRGPNLRLAVVQDNDSLVLVEGTVGKVMSARYGAENRWQCVHGLVQDAVHSGGIRCMVVSPKAMGCDPCPGVPKQLEVIFQGPRRNQLPSSPLASEVDVISYSGSDQQHHADTYSESSWCYSAQDSYVSTTSDVSSSRSDNMVMAPWGHMAPQHIQGATRTFMQETVSMPLAPTMTTMTTHSPYNLHAARPAPPSPPNHVLLVQFKYRRIGVYQATQPFKFGEHVIVEGDRGRDIGMITECRTCTEEDSKTPHPKVVRAATPSEVEYWRGELVEEETRAKQACQEMAQQLGIGVVIEHAEYQFDMKKLTFHYTATEQAVDLKQLLNDCYTTWRCRIWFKKLSKASGKGKRPGLSPHSPSAARSSSRSSDPTTPKTALSPASTRAHETFFTQPDYPFHYEEPED